VGMSAPEQINDITGATDIQRCCYYTYIQAGHSTNKCHLKCAHPVGGNHLPQVQLARVLYNCKSKLHTAQH
jgi:hypothetical protein